MACPPSSVIPASNEIRVRVEPFWKNISRVFPCNRSVASPARYFFLSVVAISRIARISSALCFLSEINVADVHTCRLFIGVAECHAFFLNQVICNVGSKNTLVELRADTFGLWGKPPKNNTRNLNAVFDDMRALHEGFFGELAVTVIS